MKALFTLMMLNIVIIFNSIAAMEQCNCECMQSGWINWHGSKQLNQQNNLQKNDESISSWTQLLPVAYAKICNATLHSHKPEELADKADCKQLRNELIKIFKKDVGCCSIYSKVDLMVEPLFSMAQRHNFSKDENIMSEIKRMDKLKDKFCEIKRVDKLKDKFCYAWHTCPSDDSKIAREFCLKRMENERAKFLKLLEEK